MDQAQLQKGLGTDLMFESFLRVAFLHEYKSHKKRVAKVMLPVFLFCTLQAILIRLLSEALPFLSEPHALLPALLQQNQHLVKHK